jgi:hypothetical protein
MEIVPVVGEEPITSSNVEIRVNALDRQRVQALVERTKIVTKVNDQETFTEARRVASELKGMLDEIETSRKQSKTPFTAVGRAIDDLAKDIAQPVQSAQNRILGLLSGYVAKLEAARKEEQRREAEARRIAQEEADRKVREAKSAQEKQVAELARELAADVEELGKDSEPPRGLVPDGRVSHGYDFELADVNMVVRAGSWRLLRWELDILACRDSVRAQLELAPDREPELPGIKITKRINVSVKAAARIK